ncbi:MAG: cryptochrome/photolyase family protein [Fimbriimonadales bacterium]|nr:MAG: cryptochrome/photolyase family protein [Fimbriimonadales bacterium]GIV11327.1 MAG: cryptochrome/photolyase family protein [Fimbriimonadales bacterium]
MRHLILILGDQLDRRSAALDGFDPTCDAVWMAEVAEEAAHVWSHKARIALFLSAMRHFRDWLRQQGYPVHYHALDDPQNKGSFATELARAVRQHHPQKLIVVEPGEWRVLQSLQQTAQQLGVPLEIRPDRHFLITIDDFKRHAAGRKQLRLEFFYREMRQRTGILMEGRQPAGGAWNYDASNRKAFGKQGPGLIPRPVSFTPDAITQEVIRLVETRFPNHPGSLRHFDWAVTPEQAEQALDDFIAHRLPLFGPYQDAMWTGEPYLYHSRLSSAINLKLLDPRVAIEKAVDAYRQNHAPLQSVEGFVRQLLGWREYIRGVYWLYMPDYLERNALNAHANLPDFYWTGETDMNCLRETIGQTLQHGFAHHIQRLMVTGLYALLLGVHPKQVHAWYLAIYVDAVEWVELPNVYGMSQFADGGLMASKPYIASGKYLQRMSNYCAGCRYKPDQATGEHACPFTTLYWDFLMRHETTFADHPRLGQQIRNLRRLSEADKQAIRRQAAALHGGSRLVGNRLGASAP